MNATIKLDYDESDPDSIKGKTFRCPITKKNGKTLLNCLHCSKFPCPALRVQDIQMLQRSAYVEQKNIQLIPRRKRMVILKKYDGTLIPDEKFDPKTAKEKDLKDIQEVYIVNKVLEKKVQLVPKKK